MISNVQKEMTAAKKIHIGRYFLTKYLDDGRSRILRIQVLDIDEMDRRALCLSIDFGMEEWLNYDQIYEADPALLDIAAQAIRFSLAEMDGFDEKEIETEAIELLSNKILIAKIKLSEEEYTCNGQHSVQKIRAIFYEDCNGMKINLNQEIAMTTKHFKSFKLDDDSLVKVMVTNITDSGIMYGQLFDDNAIPCINRLIGQTTKSRIDPKHRTNKCSSYDTYLVFDEDYNDWFRATLLAPDNQLSMFQSYVQRFNYIDYGVQRSILKNNVYKLKDLNGILAAIPPQAVSFRSVGHQHSKLKKGDLVYVTTEKDHRIPLVLVSKCF